MKYIARCALGEYSTCKSLSKCRCVKPHYLGTACNNVGFEEECMCVPVPLSYYMKEILEKDKKEKSMQGGNNE